MRKEFTNVVSTNSWETAFVFFCLHLHDIYQQCGDSGFEYTMDSR
jgi:hypothetical protein